MKNRKTNILIISTCLTSGGAERVAANLATQFHELNYNVWLIVLNGSVRTYTTTAPLIDLKQCIPKKTLKKIIWYRSLIKIIKKYKKELDITHTISFLNQPDLLNVLTKRYDKTIISVRNKRSSLNKNLFNKIKDILIFKKADIIVSLSKGVKEDLVNFYHVNEEKIKVIYNACNVETIKTLSKEKIEETNFLNSNENIVVTAGRLTNQKGQWHLIRAFTKVVENIPNAKLLVLGQGEEEQYLKNLITSLKMNSSIFLMGYQQNPYCYFSKASIFVFSSLFEGFGNTLLEAMACDLPIISTDCPVGPRELLEPKSSYHDHINDKYMECENGILIPVCDGNHYSENDKLTREELIMAEAIIELLKNQKLREKYVERSKKRIKDFSVDFINNEWVQLLK